MAESAAHLVDNVIPKEPVRQWVISFPIPLRILFAAQPQLLTPALKVIHRAISTFLIKQAGLKKRKPVPVPSRYYNDLDPPPILTFISTVFS